MEKTSFSSTDEYIATFPPDVRERLEAVRETIRANAPDAREKISYQMPTFDLHGNLVHFAAFKSHIGFYPIPQGIEAFHEELSRYKQGKGSVQFPFSEPLPLELIGRIVRYRVEQNLAAAAAKKAKRRG